MAAKPRKQGTRVISKKADAVRLAYVNVFKPRAMDEDSKPKYSVTLMIPKKSKKLIAAIEEAIEEAYENGKDKFGGKLPKKWKNPLRDGDDEDDRGERGDEFDGCYFINAASLRAPGVLDEDGDEFDEEEDMYSGCYARFAVNFYAYNVSGKGVACGLDNIKKTDDGENLGGAKPKAEDDFDDDDDDL